MKHASDLALDKIESLLQELRQFGTALVERKRGVFYLKSRAFLHFHEDGEIAYADVRLEGPDFVRMRIANAADRRRLLTAVRKRVQSRESE